jgi:regulatory protein, P-II family
MNTLVFAVVPEQYAAFFCEDAKRSGSGNIVCFSGRGTAEKVLLQRLGLGAGKKTALCFLAPEKVFTETAVLWKHRAAAHKDCIGIACSILTERKNMTEKTKYELICIVVNAGCAEQAMQAARKAGAPGGTIVDAKGTGTEQDLNFFGIPVAREKEIVLIVAENAFVPAITEAVKKLPCFTKPASTFVCTLPASDCFHLGTPCA